MAFGLPNSADLNGLADKLGAIVAALGPEESAVIAAAVQQISDHATALESKTMADVLEEGKALEDPLLERIDNLTAVLKKFESFANGFDVSVTPKSTASSAGNADLPASAGIGQREATS